MEEEIKEKVERMKIKAKAFLKEKIKAFIIDISDNFRFCEIKEVSDNWIIIEDFTGRRMGEITRYFWTDIKTFEEYQEKEKKDD